MNDADFLRWLVDSRHKRVILAEMAFWFDGVTYGTVYLSNAPYITRPTDSLPNRRYHARIVGVGDFGSHINPATLAGEKHAQIGQIELDNPDGELDFMLRLVNEGLPTKFFIGDQSWPRGWFRQVAVGYALRVRAAGEDQLIVEMLDQRLLIDASVEGAEITSGPEAGRRWPLVWGGATNLQPRLLDAAALSYAVAGNFSASTELHDVRDNGLSLGAIDDAALFAGDNVALTANAGTDTLNYAGHGLSNNDVVLVESTGTVFGGLTAGTRYWVVGVAGNDWQLSNARGGSAVDITGTVFTGTMSFKRFRYMDNTKTAGTIQLSASPAGQITVDVQNGLEQYPFDLARRLIVTYGEGSADDIDAASFDQADASLVTRLGSKYAIVGLVAGERRNLTDLLEQLLLPLGGWYAQDYDGKLRAGLVWPTAIQDQVATRTLAINDVLQLASYENLQIPFGGVLLLARQNHFPQTDGLASSLDAAARAAAARPWLEEYEAGRATGVMYSGYDADWWNHHPTAITVTMESALSPQFGTGAAVSRATSEVADALLEDARPWRQYAVVRVGLEAWDWRLGEVVNFTYPRFGCEAGWKFRIVRKVVDLADMSIELGLLTQRTPDTTTSDYP